MEWFKAAKGTEIKTYEFSLYMAFAISRNRHLPKDELEKPEGNINGVTRCQ